MWCTVTPQLGSPGQWELTQRLLYLSPSSSTCVQGTPITVHKDGCNWMSHGFLFLTLLPTASPSPPCPSRKGGAGMLWPRIRARVLRFPPSSLLEPILWESWVLPEICGAPVASLGWIQED